MKNRMLSVMLAGAVALVGGCDCGQQPVSTPLTRELLDRSLELGTRFMLANQKPAGNFNYEYDWQTGKLSAEDNQVRQAGAVWGLALIYHAARADGRTAEEAAPTAAAYERALNFFDDTATTTAAGQRFIRSAGAGSGTTGAVALLALSLVDYLRAAPPLTPERSAALNASLDAYLAQLVRARRGDGAWASAHAVTDGAPMGENNPYVDGEALLAMVKAAKYLSRDELRALALESAERGWLVHVVTARKLDADSPTTKGYYQWATMAFFELATSGWPETAHWRERVLELADWMVDVHRVLHRTRNTGYAFEGLIHAWQLAHSTGDQARATKLAHVIEVGLVKLTSWQVGSPVANELVRSAPADPLAIGGIQNHRAQPALRIDVAQHQMHAVILARRYFRK
jgi:UDP-N-acetylmuramoyl-tripeptide--D-alanyl-D-alanine ligase